VYLEPFSNAVGANFNAGLFHTARVGDGALGFNLYLGVKMFGTFIPANQRTFSLIYDGHIAVPAVGSKSVRVPATFTITDAPSIFGDTDDGAGSFIIDVDHDTTFSYLGIPFSTSIDLSQPSETIGGLANLPIFPLFVPQLGLGTLLGTDVMVRWLPPISIQDYGSTEIFGFGVRHSLSRYLPLLPFDAAIQMAWHEVSAVEEDGNHVFDLTSFAINVHASKRIGVLTLYGGLQAEESTVDISYLFEEEAGVPLERVTFTMESGYKARVVTGMGFHLGPVLFNLDVGFGHQTVVSTGLGVAL
jgi:hypothetical protein